MDIYQHEDPRENVLHTTASMTKTQIHYMKGRVEDFLADMLARSLESAVRDYLKENLDYSRINRAVEDAMIRKMVDRL